MLLKSRWSLPPSRSRGLARSSACHQASLRRLAQPTHDSDRNETLFLFYDTSARLPLGVSGTVVPANTTISGINTDGTKFTVNNNCTIANGATLALNTCADIPDHAK